MRKFNICFFILLIFSAFVFYTGWTQFKVKPGSCGIVISKTNGIDREVVIPGTFSWNWKFLIPTNAEMIQFTITPLNTEKTVSGSLPSASFYNSLSASADFSYQIDYSISLTVAPQAIPELYELNKVIDNESLNAYLQNAADSFAQLCTNYILRKAEENPSFRVESLRRDDVIKAVQPYKEFPEIDISAFAIKKAKLPDYALYRRLQTYNTENAFPSIYTDKTETGTLPADKNAEERTSDFTSDSEEDLQ